LLDAVDQLALEKKSMVREPVIVTGSSGFIGSHLCEQLVGSRNASVRVHGFDREPARQDSGFAADVGELCRDGDVDRLKAVGAKRVVHLAAESRVVFPFAEMSRFIDSNVTGTLTLLDKLQPELFVFASSSAVYGSKGSGSVSTDWTNLNPVGIYGMSKAMAELLCAEWAAATGNVAIALRFGNVIGPRCHGLIPYLVGHARRNPAGEVAAQCRGGGKIVRDYLPIRYLVAILMRAFDLPWRNGQAHAFNVGAGRGMTNRAVADVVARVLEQRGLTLTVDWSNPSPDAEASAVVLDTSETQRRFDLAAPEAEEIVAAIEETTRHFLGLPLPDLTPAAA
jgi:nucleoside-diphosphate-sugar epimerase